MRLAAAAWLAYAEGRKDEALKRRERRRSSTRRPENTPSRPAPSCPPRELLADMLLETGRPAEALVEYEAALREAPGRFNSLYGGARAAELAKKPERARELYARLVGQCVAGSPRSELAEARRFLEARG